MADRKYYCFCDSGCKFETLNKEQILAAIVQAVNDGTVGNVDTGFITTVKTINGAPLKFFVGSQSEYEALTADERKNLFALITNDTTKDALFDAIEFLRNEFNAFSNGINDGTIKAAKAKSLNVGAPVLLAENKLKDHGYYYLGASVLNTGLEYFNSFGVLYWCGNTVACTMGTFSLGIRPDGTIKIYNNDTEVFEPQVFAAKLGV